MCCPIFSLRYHVTSPFHEILNLFLDQNLAVIYWKAFSVLFNNLKRGLFQIYQWECSAETVTPDLVKQFFSIYGCGTRTLCNFYGSTEMMDVTYASFSSLEDLEEKLDTSGKVPIGTPVFNSAAYVLNENLQLVGGHGEIGQLYISSPNLCDGYVGTKPSTFLPNTVSVILFQWSQNSIPKLSK